MSGNANANYQLLLDCAVETNPKIESKKADIELYTYNEENNLFYETEISKDIYDIIIQILKKKLERKQKI